MPADGVRKPRERIQKAGAAGDLTAGPGLWLWAFREGRGEEAQGAAPAVAPGIPGNPGKGPPGKQPYNLLEMSNRAVLTY